MFAEHRDLVAQAIRSGLDLDMIERLIIDRASLDDEARAVLWLYAEALEAGQRGGANDRRECVEFGA